jgi:hypothetical protein
MRSKGRAVLAMAFVLSPMALLAQQDQGGITGRVTDASGAAVGGATVTATERETGIATRALTAADGAFTITALKVGTYRVTLEAPGFKTSVVETVPVHAQGRARVDVALEVGGRAEDVVVTAAEPLLQESSALAHVIEERQVRELPVNSRNFQALALLAAGVVPATGHRDRDAGFNSHGQWATQNNFILDGIDNNSQILGLQDRKAQVLVPSLDAVQEFSVQTGNYSAEFGRNAGAVMNVSIKSGSNAFHGTAYEFYRDDRFDARDPFDFSDRDGDGKPDPEALKQHQFGFTLGGPIARNRTFFFTSFEALLADRTRSQLATVPTAGERRGVFDPALVQVRDPVSGRMFPGNTIPRDRWDPVAARLMALWPEPNFTGATRDNYAGDSPNTIDRYQVDVRLDHHFSDEDRGFVRVSMLDFERDNEGSLPPPAVGGGADLGRDDNRAYSVAASHTHVFSSAALNEVRFGFNRLTTDKHPLGSGFPNDEFGLPVPADDAIEGLARINFTGALGYAGLGDNANNPNLKLSRTVQLLDNVTLLAGPHVLKAGLDFRFVRATIDAAAQARPIFQFNGRYTGSSLGDFLLGWPSQIQYSTPQDGDLREQDYMFYVQDDWRLSSRLTVNLGLRYDLTGPTYDAQDRMSTLDLSVFPGVIRVRQAGEEGDGWSERALIDTDRNNVAPRLGFVYRPSARWSVRGAAGIFYGTIGGGLGADARFIRNWPFFRGVTLRSTPTRPAGFFKDGVTASVLGSTTQAPDSLNWQTWTRDFEVPEVRQWTLSVQRQLSSTMVLTSSYVGSRSSHLPRELNLNSAPIGSPATERQRRPAPSIGNIDFRDPSGRASYHGLETTIDKRFSGGLRFSLSHTWSHSIDDVAELFGDEPASIVQDQLNPAADRGNSAFDRRHRLAASWLAELPFGSGRRWLSKGGLAAAVLGGWQLSGLFTWETGRFFEVTLPDATPLGVTTSLWRPDLVGNPYPADQGVDHWLDKSAFAMPQNADGSLRFGNLGRNSLRGPGAYNLDLGLMRQLDLGGDKRLQLRWEVFNVMNHPSYGFPVSNLLSPDFGRITTTVGTPRQMQVAVKVLF